MTIGLYQQVWLDVMQDVRQVLDLGTIVLEALIQQPLNVL